MSTPREPTSPLVPWCAGAEPLPGYRLVRELGRGGMGEVWEARGPGDVPVALKRVAVQGPCGERELVGLELLKGVRHPHLLAVHGYWVLEGCLVIGLELAEESLAALQQRRAQAGSPGLPREEAVRYLSDAAEALDYLARPVHGANGRTVSIQHRDVKPANLLLQGGAVKVADFGLARALEGAMPGRTFSMTPAYAAPEFFSGQAAPSSDQYSLGVTYYQLRTGRLPFTGSHAEVMHGHLHREPDLGGLSGPERQAVARALAKSPELRWASCVKFIGEVARAEPTQPKAPDVPPIPDVATAQYRGQPVTTGQLLVADGLVPIPLRRTAMRAAITASCAEVTVTQVFVNTHDRAVEATYVFPLPEDAAVYGLRMVVGERVIEGTVREKQEARETYEEARAQGHGAALVEQAAPNIFTSSLANLLPGQEIHIEVRYLQALPFEGGRYRFVFPMVVSPRYILAEAQEVPSAITAPRLPRGFLRGDAVSVEVGLDAGVPLCGFDSPSHDLVVLEEAGTSRVRVALRREDEIPNRDFVLNYRVAGPRLEHALLFAPGRDGQPGTFLLITTPPLPAMAAPMPREVVFVIDRSGSMGGEPLEQAKQAARQLLGRLAPEDTFNIIAFDDGVQELAGRPLPAEDAPLRQGQAFLDGLHARGGTEMLEPLRRALQMPSEAGKERSRMVVFLTDGSVHGERELLAALRPLIGRSRVVAFGIGTAVNRHLLNRLAEAGRGFAEFLYPGENIAHSVDRTLRRLGDAVLGDVGLQWEGGVEGVVPERCPDVYLERPLVVMGRFRGAAPPAVMVQGRRRGEAYSARVVPQQVSRHEGGAPLAALWARQQIEQRMGLIWEQPAREPELRREVIDLAIRHGLSSQFTSFLAVEYRSRAERQQAEGAVAVAVPQYTPQGMPGAPAASARPAPSGLSIHNKLDRVRAPRCSMRYEAYTGGAQAMKELPFVVGVLADLSGHPASPRPLAQRKFLPIDRDNFDDVLRRIAPRLAIFVPGQALAVELHFGEFDNFLPERLREQLPGGVPLDAVLGHPEFRRLEATWRGLRYLVLQTETSASLKLRVLDVSRQALAEDMQSAGALSQSAVYQKLHHEFDMPGGGPFGLLVGDYEFGPEDMGLLGWLSQLAASAHALFVASAGPGLSSPGAAPEAFEAFRDSEASRFVALALPRVLARAPYGPDQPAPGGELWMSSAWALAACVTGAYARYGTFDWGDAEVDCLPARHGADGKACHPAEAAVDGQLAGELSALGLLPLEWKGGDAVAFRRARSCRRQEGGLELAQLMLGARFVQYMLVMARDRVGSCQEKEDLEAELGRWINNYVNTSPQPDPSVRARYPLAGATVKVRAAGDGASGLELVAELRLHTRGGVGGPHQFVAPLPARESGPSGHSGPGPSPSP